MRHEYFFFFWRQSSWISSEEGERGALTRTPSRTPRVVDWLPNSRMRWLVFKLKLFSIRAAVDRRASPRASCVKLTLDSGLFTPNSNPPYLDAVQRIYWSVNAIRHRRRRACATCGREVSNPSVGSTGKCLSRSSHRTCPWRRTRSAPALRCWRWPDRTDIRSRRDNEYSRSRPDWPRDFLGRHPRSKAVCFRITSSIYSETFSGFFSPCSGCAVADTCFWPELCKGTLTLAGFRPDNERPFRFRSAIGDDTRPATAGWPRWSSKRPCWIHHRATDWESVAAPVASAETASSSADWWWWRRLVELPGGVNATIVPSDKATQV